MINKIRKCTLKILICTFILIFLNPSDIEKLIFSQDLGNISTFFAAIVSLINLIFVISISSRDNKNKESERKLSQTSYWYRNVIIENNISEINKIFDNLLSKIRNEGKHRNPNNLGNLINYFTENKRGLISKLNDFIRIIDEQFAESLDELLDDFEDEYTLGLEDLLKCPPPVVADKLDYLEKVIILKKNAYISKLYKYEKDGYVFIQ